MDSSRERSEDAPTPVLVNRRAGLGERDVAAELSAILNDLGVPAAVRAVEPSLLGEAVERHAREGAAVVGVAGGDGTLLTAAAALAGGEAALAPIPTGTLNHFARRLGLADLVSGARSLAGGRIASTPMGVMDDRLFLNTATFGLYADVVRRRERLRRRLTKWPAAGVAILTTLLRRREIEITLLVDGKCLRRRTLLVWVGVGWGSFPRVHQAPERRGGAELEVVILRPGTRFGLFALLMRSVLMLRGRDGPVDDPALEVLHGRHVLLHADRRIGVTLDGEPLRCEPPILVALQEDALRVLVPSCD